MNGTLNTTNRTAEYYKLYSADVRSRLAVRAPMLEASDREIGTLTGTGSWKYRPSVITDENGLVLITNGLEVAA